MLKCGIIPSNNMVKGDWMGRVEKWDQLGFEALWHPCSQLTPEVFPAGPEQEVSGRFYAWDFSFCKESDEFGGPLWSWGKRWCVETES